MLINIFNQTKAGIKLLKLIYKFMQERLRSEKKRQNKNSAVLFSFFFIIQPQHISYHLSYLPLQKKKLHCQRK